MNLSSILVKAPRCKEMPLRTNKDKSIEIINNQVFYIEPLFNEINKDYNSKIIIFSAPGASGKSALSKKISFKYRSLYWDLSKIKLGDNSFIGTLYKSVDDVQRLLSQLKKGESFIVIDAFDEAILISGINSVKDFVRDIIAVCKDCAEVDNITFVFLARTETAKELVHLCKEGEIRFSHYEIGFISEENAKEFVLEKMEKTRDDNIKKCINEQFSLIGQLLDDEEAKNLFWGIRPYLKR